MLLFVYLLDSQRVMGEIELECQSGASLINLDGVAANVHQADENGRSALEKRG